MSEVGNSSIHGSERILVLASVLIKEKLPEFIDLRGMTIYKYLVEVHCLEGGHRVHAGFTANPLEYVFNVGVQRIETEQLVVYHGTSTPFPSPCHLFFFLSLVVRLR